MDKVNHVTKNTNNFYVITCQSHSTRSLGVYTKSFIAPIDLNSWLIQILIFKHQHTRSTVRAMPREKDRQLTDHKK